MTVEEKLLETHRLYSRTGCWEGPFGCPHGYPEAKHAPRVCGSSEGHIAPQPITKKMCADCWGQEYSVEYAEEKRERTE